MAGEAAINGDALIAERARNGGAQAAALAMVAEAATSGAALMVELAINGDAQITAPVRSGVALKLRIF